MLSKSVQLALAAGSALLLLPVAAAAQSANNPWVTFTKHPEKLAVTPTTLTDSDTQVLFRMGDFDQDSWDDVAAMRKEQASQPGKRASYLLMNINGVLTDKTAQYASTSDTVGDDGFLTPRNTREVAIGDINGDGLLDMVTANSISDGDPKYLSHPGAYINLGFSGGNWLGFQNQNARVPQLFTFANPPLAVAPRFCGMGLGDVTGDGSPDVYFVDYDTTETNIIEAPNADLNDRLLVNDGNGFFVDGSQASLTSAQLVSAFGADAEMADVNADGLLDIVKDTTLGSPRNVRIIYNNPANVGNFKTMGLQDIGTGSPYGMDMGNLNNDQFMDAVIVDDGADKFRLGTGYDALNRLIWGPLKGFSFITGSDNEFGHNPYIRDLNGDGWNDVLITDVDGDLTGCDRRLHIYHNKGTIPGNMNLLLWEETELATGGEFGTGWKGVVGLTAADATGSYDVGLDDFDKDGDVDMLLATCSGTTYMQNELNPVPPVCQTDMGFGGPGSMTFSICGDDLTQIHSFATMELNGATPSAPLFVALGLSSGPVPFKGGLLVPFPILSIVSGLMTDAGGDFNSPVPGSAGTPVHVYMQCITKVGSVYDFSNGLDVLLGV
jgi:hypothetical protein